MTPTMGGFARHESSKTRDSNANYEVSRKRVKISKVKLKVVESRMLPIREGKVDTCKFLVETNFGNYVERVEAVSFGRDAHVNFEMLELGQTYLLRGNIQAEHKDGKYLGRGDSEFHMRIILGNISVSYIDTSSRTEPTGEGATTIATLQRFLGLDPSDDCRYFKNRLVKDVVIRSAKVCVYIGCGSCQKGLRRQQSIGESRQVGSTSCRKFSDDKDISKELVLIKNITIEDKFENKFQDIVYYNAESSRFIDRLGLKRPKLSGGCEDISQAIIGKRVNIHISCQPQGHIAAGYSLVASELEDLDFDVKKVL